MHAFNKEATIQYYTLKIDYLINLILEQQVQSVGLFCLTPQHSEDYKRFISLITRVEC